MGKTDKKLEFLSVILGIYVLFIGIGVPLIVKNRYFDILVVKYYFYSLSTILMFLLVLVCSAITGKERVVTYFKKFSIKDFLKNMSIADYSVIIFILVAIISTFTSEYFYESFWGNEGRFTGLFLLSLYVISYFCVSRFWIYKSYYINLIMLTGILVCLFGISDYFRLDIFGFKAPMAPQQKDIFTSTIGNINTYTAYVGIIVAITTVLFATSKKNKNMVFYYICMVISFFAIIMGVSDNAYLSLAVLFAFLPIYLFEKKNGVLRYLIVLATFFSVIQCIEWINVLFMDRVLGIDSVFNLVIGFGGLHFLVIGLWVLAITLYILNNKTKLGQMEYGKVLRYIWLGIMCVILLAVVYAFYDCNTSGDVNKYGKLSTYFLFDDEWGTHRGYIWRNVMECYNKFSPWKKFFGYGPETCGILLLQKTVGNKYDELFDNAHNEYLQILITMGLAGLTSYIVFILALIKRCFSFKKNDPYIIAIAFGIICYSVQAFVNLNVPIVTPVFWLILALSAAKSIDKNSTMK